MISLKANLSVMASQIENFELANKSNFKENFILSRKTKILSKDYSN